MSKKRQYSKESIDKAVNYVLNEGGAIRAAAKLFEVPRSTIQFKIKNPDTKFKSGPNPILTETEEQSLCDFIIDVAKRGFPRKKEDIQTCVQDYLKVNPRSNPFKNNRPGDAWFNAFLKRHPNIAIRTSEGVTNASACVSESDIRKWFDEIQKYIDEENLFDVIEDPRRIFNADETGFNICPKSGKVLAERGCKNVYEIEKAGVKENITVMFSFSAAGLCTNPMIIYKYKRIPEPIAQSVPESWGIGRSDTGWMTAAVFYDYIANVFYPQLKENNIPLPVILFVDGHKTHLTMEVSELCKELQIHLIALYPNATRILQPADVAAFKPIKSAWKKGLRDWYASNNYAKSLTKVDFAPLLKNVVTNSIKESTLINGFRVSGLYPFNKENVDYSKCLATKSANTPSLNDNINPFITMSPYLMSMEDFKNIIGETLFEKCQTATNASLSECDENFQAIYKIWKRFNGCGINLDSYQSDGSICDYGFIDQGENNEIYNFSDNETILDECTGQLLSSTNQIIPKTPEILKIVQPEAKDTNEKLRCFGNELSSQILYTNYRDNNLEINQISKDALIASPSCMTSQSQEKHLPSTSSTPPITILSNESLSEYLKRKALPESPKRKGVKQTEKLPFALTSKTYIEMLKVKKQKKEDDAAAKENRKRIREEKRLGKEVSKADINKLTKKLCIERKNKTNKKKIETVTSQNSCDMINNNTLRDAVPNCNICLKKIFKRVLECGECCKKYHVGCVPSSHRIHVPEDEGDGFLCHECYRESNSDSSDGNLYEYLKEEAKKQELI